MFLFLSKLLPLFLYPIGLTCLLLLISLVLVWKKPRWTAFTLVLAFLVLFLGSNGGLSAWLVSSLESQYLPPATVPTADAIVVLGGCTSSANPPRPWVEVSQEGDRVLYGAKLYREGRAPRVILTGGRIDWRGAGAAEAEDMAILMEPMGVPRSAMLLETKALNTRENAVNVKQIMDAQGIRRILLVTSAMHMPRSLKIFQKLGIEAIAMPTDFLITKEDNQGVAASVLGLLPDADPMRNTTRALKEYVGIAIYWLRGWL